MLENKFNKYLQGDSHYAKRKYQGIRSTGLVHYMSPRAKDWGVRLTTHHPLVLRLRIMSAVTSRVKDKSAFSLLAPRVRDRHVISAKRGRA